MDVRDGLLCWVWAMLVSDCIVLFIDSCGKKGSYTWLHKDTVALSIWTHAVHVMKNDYLTLKQAQKNDANPKQDAGCKQSCGILKTVFPT